MNTKSFLIHAPGNAIAGGCESLHQLGDAINRIGVMLQCVTTLMIKVSQSQINFLITKLNLQDLKIL